jgi:Txe/YoeB family toxin of Txe-Axe toxin-antitoxin module
MKQAALAERKGWQLSKQGNVGDKKALADAGMVVGKVNSSLQSHFEKVGETMAKEWSQKLDQEELLFYQLINNLIKSIS